MSPKTFKLGTFNVRGISKTIKQEQLSRDIDKYEIDVLCIQETKVKEITNKDVGKNRLILLETESIHYGNGFMISPRWIPHIHKFWRVNDRISVLQLESDKSKVSKAKEWRSKFVGENLRIEKSSAKTHVINIINVYAPTSVEIERDKNKAEKMHGEIEKLIKELSKISTSITLVAGDFNAKIGKKLNNEEVISIGRYSTGTRNNSGQMLIDFCEKNNLFITNSSGENGGVIALKLEEVQILCKTGLVVVFWWQGISPGH